MYSNYEMVKNHRGPVSWEEEHPSSFTWREPNHNKQMADLQTPHMDGEMRTNLIINYLPQNMTEKELYSMFVTIGPLESCRVMKDYKTGYSYGFGFVNYQKPEDAARAIGTLNGLQVQNKRLKVSYARPSGEEIKETNLYVTNLPRDITEEQLELLFGKFGNIVQKNLLKDKVTSLPRGVAFVRYDRREEAQDAIRGLNGVIPENGTEPLSVKIAEEHGKQKAAYYAGWQAGYNQSRGRGGRGAVGSARAVSGGGGGLGGSGLGVGGGGGSYGGGPSIPIRGYSQGYGAMRQDKTHNRYNPIGMGGGYNTYNWN
ncbi:sex-lethal homolog isoform X1 [Ischnura elegans]|uniref:sex-lethal homolog isoform X1 n=2 Tax=Ischnura elegans TaxID=197161 RepID=UPI001ED8770B|nr:sex-lethal homolog isoform X1 [Ischnura elegans]